MNEKEIGVDKTLYEQQESKLSEQSAAFIELLTKRGILEDARIDDDRVRQAKKEKKKNMYHNTFLLLQHYCWLTSFGQTLQTNLRITLDSTG